MTTKLSIQPIKFIPYLIKAIQELSAKIDKAEYEQTLKKQETQTK